MNLADVFTFLFVILGFLIVFVGYWLFAFALAPQVVDRCAERIGSTPVKATLLGVVTLVPLVTLGLTFSAKAPNVPLKIIALGLALITLLGALLGASGLALRIGGGLRSLRDESEPWRRVLRGGIVLGLTFVLPFIGTFIMMPLGFFAGFGALLLGRPATARATSTVPVSSVVPPLPTAAP